MTATAVVMPRLSDSMEEGTILTWLKRAGERVEVGEELVEIETDKANMAYEADVAGTLLEILVPAGKSVAIGAPIARIGDPEAAGPSVAASGPESVGAPGPPAAAAAAARVKASPLARRIARERGIDLSSVRGSGPDGRVVKADVVGAQDAPETTKGAVETVALTRPQQVVARRMSESKATAPHFYLRAEVEMDAAVAARGRLKALAGEDEVVPSINDMVVKATALALREFPRANGCYRDGRFEIYSRINVGVAVAVEDGLLVPTIFDADRKGLRQIASEARALAARARDGSLTLPELSGGTFTVSNLGMYGVSGFEAIINAPQAGILAVGAIAERPLVRDGALVAGRAMELTLSCDHRVLYGADGAQLLARIRALLEEPVALAL